MAQEPCLITAQLVAELAVHLTGRKSYLYDDLVESIDEVRELAANSYPDQDALALRAFYLLEVMYHVLIPTVVIPRIDNPNGFTKQRAPTKVSTLKSMADAGEMMEHVQNWRFPRSREGVTELMKCLQEMSDETEVDDYALALDGSVTPELRNLRYTQAMPLHSLLGHTMNFARELRKALNPSGQVAWSYFGSSFTSAWLTANQDESELLEHASRLVRIYSENALAPWSPTKNFQD